VIVLIEEAGSRMIFDNETHNEEKNKPSMFSDGPRKVVNLYSGEKVLMGGDDIDLMSAKMTILPNPERE
jgi:hypothetical protein